MAASTTLTSLTPSSVAAPSAAFLLTINGTGFADGAVAQWNGTPLTTTVVSATQLTAAVTQNLVTTSGVGTITVLEANTTSNALSCVVTNAIDLVTLPEVKQHLGIGVTSQGVPITADDAFLQSRITSISQYWLTKTCRASLNSIQTITERYDGNGRDTLLLRQWPIQSVVTLTVDGMTLPASPDYIQPGYVINQQKTGLVIIGAGCYGNGFYAVLFSPGRLNVGITYTAGYPDTPYDIVEAVIKHVAQAYKRKSWTDQESTTLPGTGGTTKFRAWCLPPECEEVLQAYRRFWP